MRPAGGFSLLEVIIAVAVIGTMIVATGTLLGRIPVEGREVRDQDLALKIARDELGFLRDSGYAALASGSFDNTLLEALPSGTGTISVTDFNARTKQVVVRVSWYGAQAIPREVTLATLVTETGGLP